MKRDDVARRRMHNSGLTASAAAADVVVYHHGAMQAQDYGPSKWSIGQRAAGLTDEDVDAALTDGSIIRTHVLRPTWHFVGRDDLRWLLALTGPRVQKHIASRCRELGLDGRTFARCEAVIASALEGGNHLTRGAVADVLDRARVDRAGQRFPFILMHCELEALICSGKLEGRKQTYALVDERVPPGGRFDRDEALVELTHRYLGSHGPATVHDLRWWSSLTLTDIKNALHDLGSKVESRTIDDLEFWSLTTQTDPPAGTTGAHLLPSYDELIVGYTKSRFFGDARANTVRTAWRDRSRPTGIVLMQGSVAGHWGRTIKKDVVELEVALYANPTPRATGALGTAAAELGRFLGLRSRVETRQL